MRRYGQLYKTKWISQIKQDLTDGGIRKLIASVWRVFTDSIWYIYAKYFAGQKTFVFQGKKYHHVIRRFNKTFRNERAIELSLAQDFLHRNDGKKILEVGNVLAHYFASAKHNTIVDKFEVGSGVINEDIVDFNPPEKFDAIISISTVEHIGFDDDTSEPDKILAAYNHMQSLLKPNGEMLITVPLGYNPELDKYLAAGKINAKNIVFFKKLSVSNDWVEIDYNPIVAGDDVTYGGNFRNANYFAAILD